MTNETLQTVEALPWLVVAWGLGLRAWRRLRGEPVPAVRKGSAFVRSRVAVDSAVLVRAFKARS